MSTPGSAPTNSDGIAAISVEVEARAGAAVRSTEASEDDSKRPHLGRQDEVRGQRQWEAMQE